MKYPQLVSMPSAVSDWLEEQLEARGIDAVVYTRYVLSLLHRDSLDLICPDQDLHIPKETTGRSRKRFRRSTYSEWWSHVRADVEQLRRSAAVECLMSASDQKCGIESLVDELCEKLKDFQSGGSESKEKCETEPKQELNVGSPIDLAKRYYAAFPPLKPNSNLITLIPHLCGKRKPTRRGPPNRSNSCGDTMKARAGGKPRSMYSNRSKKEFGFRRSMEKVTDLSEWEVYFRNRQNRADEGYSTSDTNGVDEADEPEEKAMNEDDKCLANLVAKFDRSIEALWDNDRCVEDNQANEYHDLPVDIQDLLASPVKQTDVDAMNAANQRSSNNPPGKQPFIQCGTNITSSIWSNYGGNEVMDSNLYESYCNLYNEAVETVSADQVLGDQFNYLTVGIDVGRVDNDDVNSLYDNVNENNAGRFCKPMDFTSLPWAYPEQLGGRKWSDAENYSYCSPSYKRGNKAMSESLLTLNHSEEESCFKEVVPKQVLGLPAFGNYRVAHNCITQELQIKDEEDLLTSSRTHFRPIKQEDTETAGPAQGQYADGTTFAIKGSLEQVNYRRSDSGTLYLESEFDTPKKYMEYKTLEQRSKWEDNDSCCSIEREFILKFCVKQNEKCCQTDTAPEPETPASPQEVPAKKRVLCDSEEFYFPGDEELLRDSAEVDSCECSCPRIRSKLATKLEPLFSASAETCVVHGNRPDSSLEEIARWTNNNWKKCDKCNNNWSSVWPKGEEGWKSGEQSWQHIWSSSEELCRTCLGVPAGPGTHPDRSIEYFKLREELSQDGEQLLSDLSCLQRVYMEQLPVAEISCDLNECLPLGPPSVPKERKRRHSSSLRSCAASIVTAAAVARNSWSNTSHVRIGPEYVIEKAPFTAPSSLRPVTL